jgi:hypothetical protein
MNDDSTKDMSADKTATPPPEQANQGNQSTPQPRDEEIGDYADPDAIQADGGDNSFVADEAGAADAAKKKSDAG